MKPILLINTKDRTYKRYADGKRTHHFRVPDGKSLLTAEDVEALRIGPVGYIKAMSSLTPPAAA